MNLISSKKTLLLSEMAPGILACILTYSGNPRNMTICVTCFIRDSAGAMKLHTMTVVQHFGPEIVGSVRGSFPIVLAIRGHRPTVGSSPMLHFILGVIMIVDSLVSLRCPLCMVIHTAAGDLSAYVGSVKFITGVFTGTVALKNGSLLGRAHETEKINGAVLLVALTVLFVSGLTTTLSVFDEKGLGNIRAPALLALVVALLFGAIARECRTCFAGSIRDTISMRNFDSITAIDGPLTVMSMSNPTTGRFKFSFVEQPVAHSRHIWNILGLRAVSSITILTGGCPLRQPILVDQSSSSSVVTFLGFLVGAAFYHNFGLAVSVVTAATAGTPTAPDDPAMVDKVAVIGCVVILFIVELVPKSEEGKQKVRDIYEVDAGGLPCPELVMLAAAALKGHKGESVRVLVSEPYTRMNVEKYARNQGGTAAVIERKSGLEIVTE